MCGINGFNFIDENLIQKMNEATKHRGPDDAGVFLSKRWALGHNRLSIIDLSLAGHQPMLSADKKFVITFNGEIYNFLDIKKELVDLGYQFQSKTDTEVILGAYQEWGTECLQKFNGMFACAILNTQTEELFLARDRMGIKPLYYYHKDNKFIFSSEVKAILQHNINAPLNYDALNIYFRLLYVPSPLTIWQNIFKLPPAHYAVVDEDGAIKISQYWQFKNEPLLQDKEYIKQEVSRLLHDSVKKQLMSDRPIGVFLSGGIDSTIITGIMSQLSEKVNTFSVGFEDTEEAAKYNNDFLVARRTAKYFNTEHHEYILSAKDILDNLEAAIYHMDEPISNHVQAVNLLLARHTTKVAKVVLGGDGGDELFGGYERYYYSALLDKLRGVPGARFLVSIFGKSSWRAKLQSAPDVGRYLSFFAQKEDIIKSFLANSVNQPRVLPGFLQERYFKEVDKKDFTRQFMRTDIASWLPDESLARSDKMSMASGLEQRVPFLDHRLVALADRIPAAYKIGRKGLLFGSVGKHYEGKIILREAMSEYLPQYVLDQPKWGWFSPAAKWARGPFKPLLQEVFSPSYCAGTRDLFDFKSLNTILENHISKKTYALNTLWSVMTFQLWYKRFMEPPPNPPLGKGGKWGGMPKKILIITPKFPIPTTGACEQERLAGFLQLQRLGFEIRIISKFFTWQNRDDIVSWGNERNIAIDLLPYEFRRYLSLNPFHWDGAANEYGSIKTQQLVEKTVDSFRPDLAWFDYTYLWPLYGLFRARKIPIITRSINFEPTHFLQEDGKSFINFLKFLPKFLSELKIIKQSNCLFAITPNEEQLYRKLGSKNVITLPLRSLPNLLKAERPIRETGQLHLFFMGASYNVHHNRQAAALIIKEVAPELEKRCPGKFFFHILGKKLPADLAALCYGNIKEEGFVADLNAFLEREVDIAVIPSIMGAGMQQKIFEPLVYGLPTVASPRGLAGYPFKDGEHVLLAKAKNEFVEQILRLQDINLRRQLSENALRLSRELFSQERLDGIARKGLDSVLYDQ